MSRSANPLLDREKAFRFLWREKLSWPKRRGAFINLGTFFKWIFLAGVIGAVAGGTGTLLSLCVRYVTGLREANGWILWLLPACGVLIVFLYRACKVAEPEGTDLVIEAIRSPRAVPLAMAPLIFISTSLTHLFGGSAGREGAALQLGGSLGYRAGGLFHLDEKDLHLATMCGMAACFSALFGTPLTATLFVMEVVSVGVMYYAALVPCTIASITAAAVSHMAGLKPTAFAVSGVPKAAPVPFLQTFALAALCAAVSILFCFAMRASGSLYRKCFPNPYLRAAVGGALVVSLTLVFGRDYLGMGQTAIAAAFQGTARPEAFLLKLLFTALTLSAGFKGGEIVPALFIGATFGCFSGGLLGLNPSFGAAVGFLAVFCGVTNCPLTAIALSVEVFGARGILYYLLAAGVSYLLSGYSGIYSRQRILYAKDKPVFLGKRPHPEDADAAQPDNREKFQAGIKS